MYETGGSYRQSQAECRSTGKEQEKHRETDSPHSGEDSTDSGALIKSDVHVLRNHKETKQKAELSLTSNRKLPGAEMP